jgi:glycosyltransferase involved in cell wall biosynthesis
LVPALNLLERITAFVHRNTIVMARTKEWQDAFPQIGFKPENIRVVPACIGDDWLSHDDRPHVTQPHFVWLGKFRRYKCPDHAIRAMPAVIRVLPAARLTLAGFHDDRRFENELHDLVGHLGLGDAVEFKFQITEHEKKSLLDSCRGMVLPSTVEGFGIVVLEANARGVPVIASDGVPEGAVKENVNGLRYTFGDIGALARHIIVLGSDDNLHKRLAASSVANARRFTWREVCSEYERVLEQVASGASQFTSTAI